MTCSDGIAVIDAGKDVNKLLFKRRYARLHVFRIMVDNDEI